MATPEDFNANAEYIRAADEVVDVPGGTNNNNYANINLICDIALQHRVDAVMPMWGHASENPLLPTRLSQLSHRVTFIGPPPEPMQALGDKIGSTIIAQSANVPTIAWNGDGLVVDYKKEGIPAEVYNRANVTTAEEALRCAERIGYPVMIKASEGGGGKGIRKVVRAEEVLSAYRQVQSEIPGSPIFVMKMASRARHLEVQLLADKHGEAIALSGRDCSVQRRHQKIIEEGPPTIAPPHVFRRMEQAAVSLAKTVGYSNAGTVEYLYMEDTQEFAFLELNPRLQVEHPVTENILSGLNLPACQLQVAMGLPLHRIADIRRLYGRHPMGSDTIDFAYSERVVAPRHCIAVRVTAENPDEGFQPTSGRIQELQFRSSIDVWGYFSVDNSSKVHEFADSQFGHIFASGRDRESARRAMIVALKELQIRGEIRTTIEYIIKMIQSTDFVENKFDTMWLDGRIEQHRELALVERALYCPPPALVALCGAALQGFRHFEQRGEEFIAQLQVGQVPSRDQLSPKVTIDLIFDNVKYHTQCVLSGANNVIVECNGQQQSVCIRSLADGGYIFNISSKSHVAYISTESGGSLRMVLDGHTCMFTPEYDPTRLASSVAGKLARQLVPDGSHVKAGHPYVEIEVMKMYMPLKAAEAGVIRFQLSEGATLAPGDVIATMTLDHPEKVVSSELFGGSLAVSGPVNAQNSPPLLVMRSALQELHKVLDGFWLPDEDILLAVETYLLGFEDRLIASYELDEALAVLRGRIDTVLFDKIADANTSYKAMVQAVPVASANPVWPEFPAALVLSLLDDYANTLSTDKRTPYLTQTSALWAVVEQHLYSSSVRKLVALQGLIDKYLRVEKLFDNMSFTDVVSELRKDHADNLVAVLSLCRSHVNISAKNSLVVRVMDEMRLLPFAAAAQHPLASHPNHIPIRHELNTRGVKLLLRELAKLRQPVYIHVSFTANLVIINQNNVRPESRRQRLHEAVTSALTTGDHVGEGDRQATLRRFVESNVVIRDLVLDALREDKDYRVAVLEAYLLKIYQATHNLNKMISGHSLGDDGQDRASWIKFDFVTKRVAAVQADSKTNLGLSPEKAAADNESGSPSTRRRSFTSRSLAAFQSTVRPTVFGKREGVIAAVELASDLPRLFQSIINKLSAVTNESSENVNAIHVVLIKPLSVSDTCDDQAAFLGEFLQTQTGLLIARGVRRVSFLLARPTDAVPSTRSKSSSRSRRPMSFSTTVTSTTGAPVSIFTFRLRKGFAEDILFRHIEAPQAFHLDLPRLSNFNVTLENVPISSGNVSLYRATPQGKPDGPVRFFARLVSFTADTNASESESLVVEALDLLGIVISREAANGRAVGSTGNHVFLNVVVPDSVIQSDYYRNEVHRICAKYWEKMVRLAVSALEVKVTGRLSAESHALSLRLVATNPTGFVLRVDQYFEEESAATGQVVFRTLRSSDGNGAEAAGPLGPWEGLDTETPYEVSQKFEKQRAEAMASSDTLYVYDWPALFASGVGKLWAEGSRKGDELFSCCELVLCDSVTKQPLPKGWTARQAEDSGSILLPIQREAGLNDAGMVAWLAKLYTPECPAGRELVIICNDITFQAGSFGTKEDIVFFKASEYARKHGIPRFFLAANSGARIGMAQSLKDKFRVAWTDDCDPSKGFKYIYLSKEDYDSLLSKVDGKASALPVICAPQQIAETGEVRYLISDIIGEEPDLGVENLMGSGLIAGETARAYDEIFTLTLVVARTVGIGAYLVRLGQRTVQKTRNSPIILTGYQALNKLMGREIYTTNDQLGGPMIMFPNGVSHLLAETHMDAVMKALTWLTFVPPRKGAPLPIMDIGALDRLERPVEFTPTKGSYDPRLLLCGAPALNSSWQAGFLDRDSFVEALSGWAKTVVVGRGRLGGVPIGVIVTENRTAEATKPADPADATSREKMVQQAGGVWFPDSAYKTAQALRDFNREGLPCVIFANWRGFSGGQRDMFDEVLKFGSMIVDALVAYQQPLFVYIPPFAELRGGAWVVVDSTINADVMEFYAAEDARGGVLEAAGAASIKFRDRDIILTAHRVDFELQRLDAQLKSLKTDAASRSEEVRAVEKQIKERERMLFGVFQQVAVHFADLHDTPGRMHAKGVIRKQVPWAQSRVYFYWRLRRRLFEFEMVAAHSQNAGVKDKLTRKQFSAQLREWFVTLSDSGGEEVWDDDKRLLEWTNKPANKARLDTYLHKMRLSSVSEKVREVLEEVASAATGDVGALQAALSSALAKLPADQQDKFRAALKSL